MHPVRYALDGLAARLGILRHSVHPYPGKEAAVSSYHIILIGFDREFTCMVMIFHFPPCLDMQGCLAQSRSLTETG